MSASPKLLTFLIVCGVAHSSSASEPVSAVWDLPAVGDVGKLHARWLQQELFAELMRRHVFEYSAEELQERWEAAEAAWEQSRQSARIPGPLRPPLIDSDTDRNPANVTDLPARSKPSWVESVDAMEHFLSVFAHFSDKLPGQPRLMPAKTARIEQQLAANAYVGLGVTLGLNGDIWTFPNVLPGSPAERAGLTNGVQILAIDGRPARNESSENMLDRLRGPVGSSVALRVRQEGVERYVAIRRDVIRFDALADSEDRPQREARWLLAEDQRVAYLKFRQLNSSTIHELRQVAAQVEDSCQAVILDLRQLQRAGEWRHVQMIADALIPGGILWEEVDRTGQQKTVEADRDGLFRGLPLIAIAYDDSFSPVRTLALTLQNSGRATLILESRDYNNFDFEQVIMPAASAKETDQKLLGLPTETVALAEGRWMLVLPTRQWRVSTESTATPGKRYLWQRTLRVDRWQFVKAFVNQLQGLKPPNLVAEPVYTVDPPVKGFDRRPDHDAASLAIFLARAQLETAIP